MSRTASRPLRIFLSYSREDKDYAEQVVLCLEKAGMAVLWDRHLQAGRRFSDDIRAYIEHSHVFAALLGRGSNQSQWMHAEIGYAMALNIPIVPIAIERAPDGMLQDLQAVTLPALPPGGKAFQVKARQLLTQETFADLAAPGERQPEIVQCAGDNLHRAELLAQYANRVLLIKHHGLVRQMASLTSFHLPARVGDPAWRQFFAKLSNDTLTLRKRLADESARLQDHARQSGCRLVIDPAELYPSVYGKHGPHSVKARIESMIRFLGGAGRSGIDVEIAVNDDLQRTGSITIVGDWFCSEAVSSRESANLREAIFTRNTSQIARQIDEFDAQFERLLKKAGWKRTTSRLAAIEYLKQALRRLQS